MNTDRAIRHLRVFWRAETILADIRLRRAALSIMAIGTAVLLLLLAVISVSISAYFALEPIWGSVWASAGVTGIHIWLAAIALLIAIKPRKSREMDLAIEVRDQALLALGDNIQVFRDDFESLVRSVRHPFDGAFLNILVPAAGLILKSLKKNSDSV